MTGFESPMNRSTMWMRDNSSGSGSIDYVHDGERSIESERCMELTLPSVATQFQIEGAQNIPDDKEWISSRENLEYLRCPSSAQRNYIHSDSLKEVSSSFSTDSESEIWETKRIGGKWKKFECRFVKGHTEGVACFEDSAGDTWYARNSLAKIKAAISFSLYTVVMLVVGAEGFVYLNNKGNEDRLNWIDYISYISYGMFVVFAVMNAMCALASLLPLENMTNRGYTTQVPGDSHPREHAFLKFIRFTMWSNAMWSLMGAISTCGVLIYILYMNTAVFTEDEQHYGYWSTAWLLVLYCVMMLIHMYVLSKWAWYGLYRLFDVNDLSTSTAMQRVLTTKATAQNGKVAVSENDFNFQWV